MFFGKSQHSIILYLRSSDACIGEIHLTAHRGLHQSTISAL